MCSLIPSIIQVMEEISVAYELIIVNDCSTDNTGEVVKRFQEQYPQLRLITISPRLYVPVGTAIRLGIQRAVGSIIITMDGDGSHPAKFLPIFIGETKKGMKAIIGGRYCDDQPAFQPKSRYLISKLFNKLSGFIIRSKIRDLTTGYRIFFKNIAFGLKAQDFDIHLEINAKIAKLKRLLPETVGEIPIIYKKRKVGKSKLKYLKVGPKYIFTLFKSFLKSNL